MSVHSSKLRGSVAYAFTVCIHIENKNQASITPFGPHKIYVFNARTLQHLRYHLTNAPPPPDTPLKVIHTSEQHAQRFAQNLAHKHLQVLQTN